MRDKAANNGFNCLTKSSMLLKKKKKQAKKETPCGVT